MVASAIARARAKTTVASPAIAVRRDRVLPAVQRLVPHHLAQRAPQRPTLRVEDGVAGGVRPDLHLDLLLVVGRGQPDDVPGLLEPAQHLGDRTAREAQSLAETPAARRPVPPAHLEAQHLARREPHRPGHLVAVPLQGGTEVVEEQRGELVRRVLLPGRPIHTVQRRRPAVAPGPVPSKTNRVLRTRSRGVGDDGRRTVSSGHGSPSDGVTPRAAPPRRGPAAAPSPARCRRRDGRRG